MREFLFFFFVVTAAMGADTNDILVLENQLTPLQCLEIIQQAGVNWVISISQDPTWKKWDDVLFEVFGGAIKAYQKHIGHDLGVKQDMGYMLFRRDKHNDTVAAFSTPSPVGMVLFLNGDVAGGEWVFTRQEKEIQPECGRLVVFPALYTHPRGVLNVRLGEERFITTHFKF